MPGTRRNPLFAATLAIVASIAASSAADAEIARGVQYFHTEFEHYFMTRHQAEIVALETGVFPGWFRTGTFYQFETEPKPRHVPACRFFSSLGGKATHFFTAAADECALVKGNPHWTYEGVAFYTLLPDADGACPAGTGAIHRLYNDGRGASPNHAYTPDVLKRDRLVANGWISEGVAFCLPASTGDAPAKTQLLADTIWEFPLNDASYGEGARARFGFGSARFTGVLSGFLAWFGAPEVPYLSFNEWVIGFGGATGIGRSGAESGAAGWDAGANQYVFGFTTGYDAGTVNLFDRADLPTVPVCTVTVTPNIDRRYATAYNLHPFQPVLWSPCVSGMATRIQP